MRRQAQERKNLAILWRENIVTEIGPYLSAILLGLLEGLTEFIPVSSTGHLILLGAFLGFKGQSADVFKVVIQLGAILAVLIAYRQRLQRIAIGSLRGEQASWRFIATIALAFLPSAALGVLAHGFIKAALFNPHVVAIALMVGGIAILAAERLVPKPRYVDAEAFSLRLSLGIGIMQCLALIPGVSRSGATIIGALALGAERKAAAEFSFFLAIPTMIGAAGYDLYKNRDILNFDDARLIAVGFVTAFLSALLVVRWLTGFVSRHGFAPFAWYRIALGGGMLAWLFWWA
jgi:undecaprenyl-diphosphatase